MAIPGFVGSRYPYGSGSARIERLAWIGTRYETWPAAPAGFGLACTVLHPSRFLPRRAASSRSRLDTRNFGGDGLCFDGPGQSRLLARAELSGPERHCLVARREPLSLRDLPRRCAVR